MQNAGYKLEICVCWIRLRAPVPCSRCALISFCSTKCRDLAWATHHQIECDILGILRLAGVSITCLMALRVVTLPVRYYASVKVTSCRWHFNFKWPLRSVEWLGLPRSVPFRAMSRTGMERKISKWNWNGTETTVPFRAGTVYFYTYINTMKKHFIPSNSFLWPRISCSWCFVCSWKLLNSNKIAGFSVPPSTKT